MKLISRIVFLLCIAYGAGAQDLESLGLAKDRTYFQLKGNPVTVVTRTIKPPKDAMIVLSKEAVPTGPSFVLLKEEQLQFDTAAGLLQRSVIKEIQRKKEEQVTVNYWYKRQDRRFIAQSNYKENKLEDSAFLKYNKSGQLLQYISYNNKGKTIFRVTYTYDRKKQLTIIRKLNEDDFPVAMVKYKYAASGLLTETQHFDKNFRQVATKKYSVKREQDGSVNLSSATYNDLNTLQEGLTQVKDAEGRLVEESQVDQDRRISEYHGYEYNEHGDLAGEKTISETIEQHMVYRYRYDNKNNWTSRETYKNEELQSVEERTLTY
jgi:hypothetical protein